MISFQIRSTDDSSLPLLQCCFSNKEFCNMLYGDAHVNINKYIENNGVDIKYTCSFRTSNNTPYYDLGFANCYKKADGCYTYIGGINPQYFNTGLGVKGDVAMLSFIFDRHPNIKLTTGVYKYNVRSIKLTQAVGFYPIGETDSVMLFRMEKENFHNPFVERIQKVISID